MTHSTEPEPLQPMLEAVEAELENRLEKVCELTDVHEESTGEFIRLEERLLEAAQAAKQAFSLRRRLRAQRESETAEPSPAPSDAAGTAVRTVRDAAGLEWRVWAVTPQRMRSNPSTSEQLGDYKDGWLAFESTDGSQRRRLPLFPGEWERVSPNELLELLARATPARKVRHDD